MWKLPFYTPVSLLYNSLGRDPNTLSPLWRLLMNPSRRSFLKAGTGAVVASVLGFDLKTAYAQASELKIARTTETRSTCPYCSVSCGVIIHTIGDKAKNVTAQVVHVEGDPDHPINRGTLCPKG